MRLSGPAMRPHSWTNNGQPLFSAGPAGRSLLFERDLFGKPVPTFPDHAAETGFSRHGRRFGRTATNEERQRATHADGDFDRALAQPLPYIRAADAVPVPESAARRRLHRTRF